MDKVSFFFPRWRLRDLDMTAIPDWSIHVRACDFPPKGRNKKTSPLEKINIFACSSCKNPVLEMQMKSFFRSVLGTVFSFKNPLRNRDAYSACLDVP